MGMAIAHAYQPKKLVMNGMEGTASPSPTDAAPIEVGISIPAILFMIDRTIVAI
jgi:uncharacterized protein (DUF362 family)